MKLWLLLSCVALAAAGFTWEDTTPLDEYVHRDDGVFNYTKVGAYEQEGFSLHVYNMTSVRWLDVSIASQPNWWHYVSLAVPKEIKYPDAAFLYIGGGHWTQGEPGPDSEPVMTRIGKLCQEIGAPVAYVKYIPFQPTRFKGDRHPRIEDQIIARSWRLYLDGTVKQPEVVVLFPMVKAAKLTVDLVVAEVKAINGNDIVKVMPTGRSKRGWTSWLLACVDRRVFAFSPVVLDHLNWHENLHHHYQSLGGWSWAFQPYWKEGLSRHLNDPKSAEIFEKLPIDPFVFNERLGPLPKLVVVGTGDQFFLLDDSHYFFNRLEGSRNYMLVLENTDHSLNGQLDRLWDNYRAFFVAAYEDFNFPTIFQKRWSMGDGSGTLVVRTDRLPRRVRGWAARTTNVTIERDGTHRRDFRSRTLFKENPIRWEEADVQVFKGYIYSMSFDPRDDGGYIGFFMEMTFEGVGEGYELQFTSEVQIVPDLFPFPRCESERMCRGILK